MRLWRTAFAAVTVMGASLPAAAQQEVAQTVYAKVAPSVVLIIVQDASGKAISKAPDSSSTAIS